MRYENAPRGRRVPVGSPARLMAARLMLDIKPEEKMFRPQRGALIRGFGIILPCALGFALGDKGFLVALWALVEQAQPSMSHPKPRGAVESVYC